MVGGDPPGDPPPHGGPCPAEAQLGGQAGWKAGKGSVCVGGTSRIVPGHAGPGGKDGCYSRCSRKPQSHCPLRTVVWIAALAVVMLWMRVWVAHMLYLIHEFLKEVSIVPSR